MKEFQAFYSKAYSAVFLIASIMVALLSVGSTFLGNGAEIWVLTAVTAALAILFFCLFTVNVRKSGVAVEVRDGKLVFHKKKRVEIPLKDITKVSMNVGFGSFDISVKTKTQRFSMHCFIKQDMAKKNQLRSLFESEDIHVSTYTNSTHMRKGKML